MEKHPNSTADRAKRHSRIVLTGGPGAGKSVVTAMLAEQHPELFVRVPEAATQVYSARNTRWDRLDLDGRHDVQREIYHLQVAQEERLAAQNPGKVLLLDRGTVDGAAYWPEGPEAYWADLGTSLARELARYDAVLVLQTSAAIGLYDGDGSNPTRFEDASGAIKAEETLVSLWQAHGHLFRVDACETIEGKTQNVMGVLKRELGIGR